MTTIIGPGVSAPTANKIRSTYVYGTFGNFDKSDGTIPAYAAFQRNVLVAGNLILGTETLDDSGNAVDSSSNIMFTLNKTAHSIPLKTLSYIKNLSSDVQTQITNISASAGNISSVGYITQTLSDITSTQFGNQAYNKTSTGTENTSFGSNNLSKNTTGKWNTSVGNSSLSSNTNGFACTSVGQLSLSSNTSGIGNTSVGCRALALNTTGNANTCIGVSAGSNILTGYYNVALGQYTGISMVNIIGGTCIGYQSDCAFNYSTSIGYQSTCTADRQIMLETSSENVVVAGGLSVAGSINNISNTVFGYLSNASSNIQSQINTVSSNLANIGNNPLVLSSTLNVSGLSTLTQVKINSSLEVLQNISFVGTLNNISETTFSYLSGLTSNIQNQINAIVNTTPVGSVLSYAGTPYILSGYLACDGSLYENSSYPALFNVIGYTYGGYPQYARFRVPNFRGLFLRGAGSQIVSLNAIAGSGNAVGKTYTSPALGTTYADETQEITTSDYVNQINQEVKTFVTGGSGFGGNSFNFNYANAVSSLNYTVNHDTINRGHVETFPVHTSIQYFIKY